MPLILLSICFSAYSNTNKPTEKPIILHKNYPQKELIICQLSVIELTTFFDPAYDYQWQLDGIDITYATYGTLWTNKTGVYTVRKKSTSTGTVFNSDAFVIKLIATLPPIEIEDLIQKPCEGEKVTLKIKAPYVNGNWYSSTQSLGMSESLEVMATERYTVSYGGDYGCALVEDKIDVDFYPVPENPTSGATQYETCEDEVFELIIPQKPDYAYIWFKDNIRLPNDGQSTLKTTEWGIYTVKITNSVSQCSIFSNQFIISENPNCNASLFIPNIFTPNGDGINDVWDIKNLELQVKYEINVYNQWGAIIYHDTENNQKWDGRYSGIEVENGSYLYEIKVMGKETVRGNVTLLR